ncbi:MAG: hypothetical protein ACRCX2_33940 [Paraclostridium sp.]
MKNYNLQIPIDKALECKLRTIANEEDRALRSLCRRILQAYVDGYEDIGIDNDDTPISNNVSDDSNDKFDFDFN